MIKAKKKPCKGINRAKDFKGCGELRYRVKYGLCKDCLKEWVYSTKEGAEYLKHNVIPQAKKEVKAKQKEKDNKIREKLKTLGKLENEAKTQFQKFIRLRDKDLPCASCGTTETNLWDGGHFYKAEIYSGLIFDERNCHKQCRRCNRFLGGNENNYRLGLIKRFSLSFVLQLDADAIKLRDYKYERQELIDIKNKYKEKIRELEK